MGATVRRQGAGIRWTMRWRKYCRPKARSKRIGMESSGPQEAARRAVAPYRDLTISVECSS